MDQSEQDQAGKTPSMEVDADRTGTQGPELEHRQPILGGRGEQGKRAQKEIVEWVKALAIAGILVFIIRWFLFSPFIVDGPSMHPNFETGERLIVNKILYDIRPPKHGEVVVFYVPEEDRDFIKRVIAVPGDKVKYEGDNLYINGKKIEEPYIKKAIEEYHAKGENYNNESDFPNELVKNGTVPAGNILAFGDNRRNSTDSRIIGYIPYDRIIGRADVIFWPFDKIKLVKQK